MRPAPPDPTGFARWVVLSLALAGAAFMAPGCGGRTVKDDAPALAACLAKHGTVPRMTVVPACIRTAKGVMAVETEYLPGVVDCELGWFTKAAPALQAQAIAARTYLMSHLARRNNEETLIAIGPRFQCWRKAKHDRSKAAVLATRDQVLHRNGLFLLGNYVAGAKHRDADCKPESPRRHGYAYDTWDDMRAAYDASRKRGVRGPFKGVYWTELLVTDNAGKQGEEVTGTPFASTSPLNRGALGQYAAACIANRDAPALPVSATPLHDLLEDALGGGPDRWMTPARGLPTPAACGPRDRRKRKRTERATPSRTRDAARSGKSKSGKAKTEAQPTPESIIAEATGLKLDAHGGHPPGSVGSILAHFYGADVEISAAWRPEDAARLLEALHDDGILESGPGEAQMGGTQFTDEDPP